jgi:hypothetical protein
LVGEQWCGSLNQITPAAPVTIAMARCRDAAKADRTGPFEY